MASNINNYLLQIQRATYGEEVRSAIHDSIAECYADVQNGVTTAQNVAERANTVISSAETAASQAQSTANNTSTTLNNKIIAFDTQVSQKFASYDTAIGNKTSQVDASLQNMAAQITTTEDARVRAVTAAQTIEELTVSYENVGANEQGAAILRTVNNHRDILFKLRQGAKGESNVVKGSAYATITALKAAVPNPAIGDMYNVGASAPYNVYRWTGDTSVGDDGWEDQGQFGVNIDAISSNDIDTIWSGSSPSGSDSTYLNRAGLGNLVGKILTALSGKVNTDGTKTLTDENFTAAYKTKLDGIAAGAKVNVQPDWNQTNVSADDYIKNKPTIPSGVIVDSALSDSSTNAVQNKVIKAAIDNLAAGHLTISVNAYTPTWVSSGDSNFPYYTDIPFTGIDDTWYAEVVYSSSDAMSGMYSPTCDTRSDAKVRIWAINNTVTSLTIPTISAWR